MRANSSIARMAGSNKKGGPEAALWSCTSTDYLNRYWTPSWMR